MNDSLLLSTKPPTSLVTGVLTSCNRHDLLEKTLDSFLAQNTYDLAEIIVVEDGDAVAAALCDKYRPHRIKWISTGRRVGQIAAIDYAYSLVKTPYIFHMEDDWEFYRSGFIERSLQLLQRHAKCLQVWIRALNDSKHTVEPRIYRVNDVPWQKLTRDFDGMWHGFSFNPGLRRVTDYVAVGGYSNYAAFQFNRPNRAEAAIGAVYRERGYFAAILVDEGGTGYVRHIGAGRHVRSPKDQ